MEVKIKPNQYGARELQWARRLHSDTQQIWEAHSLDRERLYNVSGIDDGIMWQWSLGWRVGSEPPQFGATTFFNRYEAQEVAQHIEMRYEVNEEKLKDIAAGNEITVGGNAWKYYGIHDNKRLWICVLPGENSAYVATSSYDDPKQTWVISKREWVPSGKNDEMQKLDIKKLGEYKNLTQAQMSVARLTYNGSKSSLANTDERDEP
jgi:hypothetical protein